MTEFKFDINKSVQENIDSFFILLKLVDEEMANLLISNIDKMIPLPEEAHQKTSARVTFNEAVKEGLEKLKKSKGAEE
jgi:hypothetical protein